MRRKGRRRIAFRFYVLLFAAVCLFGYGVYMALGSLIQRTAVIESGSLGNRYPVEAVILRDEAVTDAEGLSRVMYAAGEGALVFKGNKIAEVYATGYSKTDENRLLEVQSKIKNHYRDVVLLSGYTDNTLERLDDQILAYARELELLVHGKAAGNLLNIQQQLENTLSSRQKYLKDKYKSDQTLSDLYANEASLQSKINTWSKQYLAEKDCLVSFYTDGYESMLDVTDFDSITLAEVRSILNGETPPMTTSQRGRTAVFREVNPNGWYLLLVCHDRNWNPVAGQSYKVQLEGFEAQVIEGTVSSFTRSGNELLVRMTVAGDVRTVLNTRTAKGEVSEDYVAELKVPIGAIHIQGNERGVVLTDGGGIFVPVNVVLQDNEYAVIQPITPGALSEGQKVRVF